MTIETYKKSADYIRGKIHELPSAAIVLGSGLGAFADKLTESTVIPYSDIPEFPRSTVANHKGELIYGKANGVPVLVMSGRFHYYEGYDMKMTAYPICVFNLLGIKKVILTNAVGGINRTFHPGDLVCVYDHIKFAAESPVRGENLSDFGPRFFDMQSVYDKELIKLAKKCALKENIELKEGVYAYMSGPQYETPAEIRMLAAIGADLVGMSTVAEVIQAAHCKMKVLCISYVSNYAAGVTNQPLTHEEVIEAGEQVADKFCRLMNNIIEEI